MTKYALIENSTVVNLIVADSKEIAEELTGKQCIESDNEQIIVGSVLVDGILKPYASWILNDENKWVPPIPEPDITGTRKYFQWNEENMNYDLFDVPADLLNP
jgi:hypothetical protein